MSKKTNFAKLGTHEIAALDSKGDILGRKRIRPSIAGGGSQRLDAGDLDTIVGGSGVPTVANGTTGASPPPVKGGAKV